ncbi:MAG: alpha/beta hydrolase family protein [Isosphaeraceae bacterium]
MNRLIGAVAFAVLIAAQAGANGQEAGKATSREIAGDWESTLNVTPQIGLRITLKIERAKDGALSGTWGSPEEGLEGLPLASITFRDGAVELATKHGATFKGRLNEASTDLDGEWLQHGRKYALKFRRFDPARVPARPPIPKELEGIWEGTLKIQKTISLRLVLRVEKNKDGRLGATLASPDQGAARIAVTAIGLRDGELTFESKVVGAKYAGKRNKDGTGFDGEFQQGGLKIPLVLKKTDKVVEPSRPQTPRPPFPYRSESVSYDNTAGGVKLAGTLTMPNGGGPYPAVLLITGSGAQDRDETIFAHKPFLVIADYLTRRGIAVLRVDDRGVGGSTDKGPDETLDDHVGDVLAGVAFLKGRREIDPSRIGLAGHSEGGIIAPLAFVRSPDVAYIILMAGTGLPGVEILKAQGRLISRVEGATDAELERSAKVQQRLLDILIEEKDVEKARTRIAKAAREIMAGMTEAEKKDLRESGGDLAALAEPFNSAWFRSFVTYDPRPTLKKVRCPVLAINGEKDLQVPAKENLDEIRKALESGGNRDVKVIAFPGVNHLFQPCKTGSPGEYGTIETTIAPEVLKAMADWISVKTVSRPR